MTKYKVKPVALGTTEVDTNQLLPTCAFPG